MNQKNDDKFPIEITDLAIEQVKKIKKEHNYSDDKVFRIGIKPGRCSLFLYAVGFDDKKPKDIIKVIDGIEFAVSPNHVIYIDGMKVDWKNEIMKQGFSFDNPKYKD